LILYGVNKVKEIVYIVEIRSREVDDSWKDINEFHNEECRKESEESGNSVDRETIQD